jgi:hypothetical protein
MDLTQISDFLVLKGWAIDFFPQLGLGGGLVELLYLSTFVYI